MSKKQSFLACLIASLLLSMIASANAWNLVESDPVNITSRTFNCVNGRYRVDLDPFPPVNWNIFAGSEGQVLQNSFPGWTFEIGGWDPGGTIDVKQYDVGIGLPWNPPKYFRVYYGGGTLPGSGWSWQWIQFVITNRPRDDAPKDTPYVDPYPSDDSGVPLPFYHSDDEISKNQFPKWDPEPIYNPAPGVDIQFLDRPARGLADAHVNDPVIWKAHLFIAAWDGNVPGVVKIPSLGLEWGFTITRIGDGNAPGGNIDRAGVAGDGDKLDEYLASPPDYGYEVKGVGGIVLPVDKFALLAPYIGLTSTIVVAAVVSVVYVKRVKRRKEKQ